VLSHRATRSIFYVHREIRTSLLALGPAVDDRVKDVCIGAKVGMLERIGLVRADHVGQKTIRLRGRATLTRLGKGVNHSTVRHNIRLDVRVTHFVEPVHLVQQFLGFVRCIATTVTLGPAVDHAVISDRVRLGQDVAFFMHLLHTQEQVLGLGGGFLAARLGVGVNDRVEGILVRTDIQVLEGIHPLQDLFRTRRSQL
jgi:hypothetical protein